MADGNDRASSQLRRCGAPEDAIRPLRLGADLVRYWDLTTPGERDPLIDLVVEAGGRPLLFVRSRPAEPALLAKLRRVLALRGDGSPLALYEPGRLSLYDVALDDEKPAPPREIYDDAPDPWLIPSLLDRRGEARGVAARFILKLMHEATDAITGLKGAEGRLTADDALSLAGRALFLRFLFDRGIVGDAHVGRVARGAQRVEDLFVNADLAHATSAWLDDTFNGNLLPLPGGGTRAWFRSLPPEAFQPLSNIMHRAPSGQLSLPLGWDGIDFAHIPPGLLSEVYEAHCARHYDRADAESVHYTPRSVAELMVSESLSALERPWEARVLDPAAGAGVFLVAAYRGLVEAHWRHTGERPQRATLRSILNRQLVGFDINETALRLAALSLYLTALELDPEPTPPDALRFDELQGKILFDVRAPRQTKGEVDPGSLGSQVDAAREGRYDLVVGNPPWTAWAGGAPAIVQQGVDRVFHTRGGAGAVTLADKAPDLAFLWRAMGWARPGGRIALAMSSRLLFRQSERGVAARNEVLQALKVTGIINGSALRDTEFWPGVRGPFCVLFAENTVPSNDAALWLVSPEFDPRLNDHGRTRVDMESAVPVSSREACEVTWALKARFRGNSADRDLLSRLVRFPTLKAWWNDTLGLHEKHQGYQRGGDAGEQQDAREFWNLPDLRPESVKSGPGFFSLDEVRLPPFERPTLLRTRQRDLYRHPLVIVPKRIRPDRNRGRAALSTRDVFFCESYHGWSCARSREPELLSRYLHLLFNSDLVRYVALLTSSQYGVERDAVLLEDLERLPIRPLDSLAEAQRAQIEPLSRTLIAGPPPWSELDAWVADVYGLSPLDRETIRDTLAVSTPEGQSLAQAPPSMAEREAWSESVVIATNSLLEPFGRRLSYTANSARTFGAWIVVRFALAPPLATGASGMVPFPSNDGPLSTSEVLRHADDLAATEVTAREPDGTIVTARVAQYRYWTPTRARLFAARLIREHGDVLAGL
ncbi:MAG: SAM-dependent DNA methyltransferase [Deltaproteobacteria bacterium]|jgi:hypothetical protein|nr:SAM-dependent DNA methyltransferase [Deltaproteobacteria bacterium]